MEWWTGKQAVKVQGNIDRSATLYRLALELANANANHLTIADAIAERDIGLGYEKYATRKDAD